jgi:cytosine/adenosine deaminase-related metal-dependent hydrolase
VKLVRARIVLPISQAAIEDGAVALAGKRIVAVGRWADLRGLAPKDIIDLGENILLPGLINAHCHLDYTDLGGKLPAQKTFTDWIKGLVALKASWSDEDFAFSWQHGAEMLLRNGVTTVADIESIPELIPALWERTPLRVISFRELIGLKRNVRDLIRNATRQ